MRVSGIRIETRPRGAALCADVSSDNGAFGPFPLWIEFLRLSPDQLLPNGDAFVPALLWAAMKLGEPLAIEAGISTELHENLEAIQTISVAALPGLRRVPVKTFCRPALPAARGSGLFFSCGIDSFYSLLKHRASLTHLICVQGFDMTMAEDEPFSRLYSATCEAARETGLEALEVRTNLRELINPFFPWNKGYVSGLAAVGLAAQGLIGRCMFASACDLSSRSSRLDHPILDPLWSAESLHMVQDGYELNRLEKVARVSDCDLAMRLLRVCLADPLAYNCGRCEKCVRSMLELYVVRALDRCTTFPRDLQPADVARTRISNPATITFYEEVLRALGNSPLDRQYATAIRHALWMGTARRQYGAICQTLERAPGGKVPAKALKRTKALWSTLRDRG
jgi:hypothetical protein